MKHVGERARDKRGKVYIRVQCVPKAAIGPDAVPRDLNKPRCTELSDHRGITNKGKRQDVEFGGTNVCCTTEGGSSSPGYNSYEDG